MCIETNMDMKNTSKQKVRVAQLHMRNGPAHSSL